MAAWTEYRDGTAAVWWTLGASLWRVERVERGGRYRYDCYHGEVRHASKDELVNAKRHCERDGQPFLMPWGWTTTPEAGS